MSVASGLPRQDQADHQPTSGDCDQDHARMSLPEAFVRLWHVPCSYRQNAKRVSPKTGALALRKINSWSGDFSILKQAATATWPAGSYLVVLQMDTLIARLGLALSIGLLVGLERGWQEREAPEGSRTAGMRTFGISGLLGGVLAVLAQTLNSPVVFAIGFLSFAVTLGVFKLREARSDSDYSVTTVMAGLGVLALGGLAATGFRHKGIGGGVGIEAGRSAAGGTGTDGDGPTRRILRAPDTSPRRTGLRGGHRFRAEPAYQQRVMRREAELRCATGDQLPCQRGKPVGMNLTIGRGEPQNRFVSDPVHTERMNG